MSLSELPLSYCTNVHPGRTVAEVEAGLDRYAIAIARRIGHPLAAGLWLARPVVSELLATADGVARFADGLKRRGLRCYTLNAFPYGDFHDARVKEKVYLPDWSTVERLDYTLDCARVLAELLDTQDEGSISTLPLGFKGFAHPPDFLDRCAQQLIEAARALDALRDRTGKKIRLAVEPEPLCLLERTVEAIDFFRRLRQRSAKAGCLDIVHTHVGLCFDVCHQAVEFEDVADAIDELDEAGVRINKVHLSCAIALDRPMANDEGRMALRRYIEPRYLHQTLARTPLGIESQVDLSEALLDRPPAAFADASEWRVHFHVPVDVHRLGPLGTTRADLARALAAVAMLDYAPHLEVETYTWEVMPGANPQDLVEGLSRELLSAQKMIDDAAGGP